MGEPVLERKVHSVRTAARELGMDPRRLRKLLVDARTARPHLDRINARVSAKDFQDALSMSRSQFDLLRKEGNFRAAIEGGDHKPLWDVRAAHRHLESLLSGAEPIYLPMHAWDNIPTTAQSLKASPGTILKRLEVGRVRRIGRHMDQDEIERLLSRYQYRGLRPPVLSDTRCRHASCK